MECWLVSVSKFSKHYDTLRSVLSSKTLNGNSQITFLYKGARLLCRRSLKCYNLMYTYLQGLHHKSCWSRPYLARHFFKLLSVIEKNLNVTKSVLLQIYFFKQYINSFQSNITYSDHYSKYNLDCSSHLLVVVVFCFSFCFVHSYLLQTTPGTFAYEVDVLCVLDRNI